MKTREQLEDRIAELEELLGATVPPPWATAMSALGMTGHQARIACMLLKREFWSYEGLAIGLYDEERRDALTSNVIHALLSQTRAKLSAYGIFAETLHGVGVRMLRDDKAKLRALLDAWEKPPVVATARAIMERPRVVLPQAPVPNLSLRVRRKSGLPWRKAVTI